MQRRRERERSFGQIVQSLLAMSRWIPAIAAMPRDAGVRSKVAEVRRPAHRGLWRTHDPTQSRGRSARWKERAGSGGREPSARCSAIAGRRVAHTASSSPQKLNDPTFSFFFFPFFFFFDQSYAFRPVISFFSNVKGKLVNTLENLRSFREKEVKERSCSARSVLFFFLFLEIPKFRIASSNLYEKKLEKKENFNFVKKEGG